MRDLKADLEICNKATPGPWKNEHSHSGEIVFANSNVVCFPYKQDDGRFIAAAREGWPEAIERAIKAEAEVERLKKVYVITNESWKKQVEENALLRKVAEAAKGVCALCPVRDTCVPNDCWVWPIKVALKEGER